MNFWNNIQPFKHCNAINIPFYQIRKNWDKYFILRKVLSCTASGKLYWYNMHKKQFSIMSQKLFIPFDLMILLQGSNAYKIMWNENSYLLSWQQAYYMPCCVLDIGEKCNSWP
jgi:hypothetical protein